MTGAALVEAARGDRQLDLLIRGGQMLNVYTGEIYPADIGIFADRIAVVAVSYTHLHSSPIISLSLVFPQLIRMVLFPAR